MSESDDSQNTRPISVAELLARNGTIGAPPAGGRRRRRRGNADAVSVSELTGEIPVIRDEPAPEPVAEELIAEDPVADEAAAVEEVSAETVVIYSEDQEQATTVIIADEPADETTEETEDAEGADDVHVVEDTDETDEIVEDVDEADETDEVDEDADEAVEIVKDVEEADEDVVDEVGEAAEPEPEPEPEPEDFSEPPPLSEEPVPSRASGPLRSDYPRPSSGAEEMAPDPVDESIDLDELLSAQGEDPEELRSYLQASSGALFSGETLADDIARRGPVTEVIVEAVPESVPEAFAAADRGGRLGGFRQALTAVFQSVLAVLFGAGLFLGFDQLWRWNTIVALVLSVLVILGLVIAVRVVRKTEDIASTLIAVAVGALVTLGPLALLQST